MYNLERNLLRWSFITILSAAPSFLIARGLDQLAMLSGIAIIICCYTLLTSSEWYRQSKAQFPLLHHSAGIAYALRVALSVVQLGSIAIYGIGKSMPLLFPDLLAGMAAYFATGMVFPVKHETFFHILLITLTEAVIMSAALLALGGLICVMRSFWQGFTRELREGRIAYCLNHQNFGLTGLNAAGRRQVSLPHEWCRLSDSN